VDVVDLGLQKTQFGEKYKVKLVWQVEERDVENDNRRFRVQQWYTNSDSEKSNLRKMLESWRGKRFTEDEIAAFDIESVIGKNCQVQVVHTIKAEGKVFANIQAIISPRQGEVPLEAEDYEREAERSEARGNGNESESGTPGELTESDIPF
jgi:hypothetical protein